LVETEGHNILDSWSLVAASSTLSFKRNFPVPTKFVAVVWHEMGGAVAAKKVMVYVFAGYRVQAATG
jgi:hypothetical protein